MRIFKNRWFEKYARKQAITDGALIEAVNRAESGLVDADLGGGVLKQRIARKGGGKSGGYRSIILFRARDRAIVVFAFAKSDRANLTADEVAGFRKIAAPLLALSHAELDEKVKAGSLIEVDYGQSL